MRKILFVILCFVSMLAFSQNVIIGKVFPGKEISKQYHFSFRGISFATNKQNFEKIAKQKGYTFCNGENYDFCGSFYTLPKAYFSIIYTDNFDEVKEIRAYFKFHNNQKANTFLSSFLKSLNNIYSKKIITKRVSYSGKNNLTTKYIYNTFSKDDKYHVGNIEISLENNFDINEYDLYVSYRDVPNNFINEGYVYKIYNLSCCSNPIYKKAYYNVYPNYQELELYKDNKDKNIMYDGSYIYDLEKLIKSSKYSYEEKKYIINKYLAYISTNNNNTDKNKMYEVSDVYNIRHKYDRAKQEYLKTQSQNDEQMSPGEAMFCLWEGSERIAKYKADGSYQTRMRNFIRRWNAVAGSGGGSTNWDGLSDAQKAAIHEHDNAR